MKLYLRRISLILLLVFILSGTVQAQGNTLTYGSAVIGSLSSQAPLAFFTFSGNEGDQVTIRVIALDSNLDPNISMNSPTQQQLAINDNDPFVSGTTDARIDIRLPATGVYTILVGSNGSAGDFVVRLDGRPEEDSAPLEGSPVENAVTAQPITYSFIASPDSPLVLTLTTETSGFDFRALVQNSSGQIIAILFGGEGNPATFSVPVGDESYQVEIASMNPQITGNITASLALSGPAAVPPPAETEEPAPPVETEEPEAPVTTEEPAATCVVRTPDSDNRNVRSGPGTDFNIVGQVQPGQSLKVVGVSGDWYLIELAEGGQGWVRNDVVSIEGPCDNLPVITDDGGFEPVTATPTALSEATATATPSPAADEVQPATMTFTPSPTTAQQPTATFTPSYTPTSTATQPQAIATFTPSYTPTTPPAAQVAPEDARFNNPLNLALDTTGSVTDFVSYPGGDREDRVRWDITGMNQNASLSGGRARLILAVSCFGNNIDQIQFFTGGQTFSCGQTIVDREVTADSRTGSVVITAVGGTGTYVQWVLTGTATRIN
ncbi:MAG: SH3 domain-containing protein [Anaerolineae bacterium]|nr:SH3 domain-containing protein [Anaerolineae bacterium]